jgi:hypothetical protein
MKFDSDPYDYGAQINPLEVVDYWTVVLTQELPARIGRFVDSLIVYGDSKEMEARDTLVRPDGLGIKLQPHSPVVDRVER